MVQFKGMSTWKTVLLKLPQPQDHAFFEPSIKGLELFLQVTRSGHLPSHSFLPLRAAKVIKQPWNGNEENNLANTIIKWYVGSARVSMGVCMCVHVFVDGGLLFWFEVLGFVCCWLIILNRWVLM